MRKKRKRDMRNGEAAVGAGLGAGLLAFAMAMRMRPPEGKAFHDPSAGLCDDGFECRGKPGFPADEDGPDPRGTPDWGGADM